MPRSVTPKKIARALADWLLFIPRGIVLPLLKGISDTAELLKHDQIACVYCHRQVLPPKNAKGNFSFFVLRIFNSIEHFLREHIHESIVWSISLLKRGFANDKLRKMNRFLQSLLQKILPKVAPFANWLSDNRNQIVWYGVLPLFLISGCAWVYGFGIIPELYIFMVASFWGGKIINHTANMIVYKKKSAEWSFLSNIGNVSSSAKTEAKNLSKRLAMEVVLLHFIGKIPQFIASCFQAFFGWLLFYVLVKTATEEMPFMMSKFEQRLDKNRVANNQYRFDNFVWLVSYKLFTLTGSDSAQQNYRQLHERKHHTVHERHNKAIKQTYYR
ncbi:MAG: hypothetical protein JSR17_06815 [Proteobacteria bacterium]|nr:hypothetical protein [Pseudomonadota bacterium]